MGTQSIVLLLPTSALSLNRKCESVLQLLKMLASSWSVDASMVSLPIRKELCVSSKQNRNLPIKVKTATILVHRSFCTLSKQY